MLSTPRVFALLLLLPVAVVSFVVAPQNIRHSGSSVPVVPVLQAQQQTVQVEAILDDEKVTSLFAWVSLAFVGEPGYNNLMLAFAAIFGDLPEDSAPVKMAKEARKKLPPEEETVGDPLSVEEREQNSLGAMGAGQWSGQFRTRPHALLELELKNITDVDDWVKSLPRGCKRTIKKALSQKFTVTSKPILGDKPAPHSSLAHFRCVVAHEVRLLSWGADGFFDALGEAVSRYIGTTRMTGEIREYRNEEGKVIAIAHEVRKGKTIRGQWFYADDEASQTYVWFHSVYDLVRRAIDAEGVNVVDLGPSGSDAFSELKAKYGFRSVVDWPAVADYQGDFWYVDGPRKSGWFGLL
jgi:hypothetical protein